ncbi:MAG: translation initiation factor IF-2 [Bacteroidales bacterium]
MPEVTKPKRLSKAAKEFNVGLTNIVETLSEKGFDIEAKPNTKLTPEMYNILIQEFQAEKSVKEEAKKREVGSYKHDISMEDQPAAGETEKETETEDEEKEQGDLIIKNVAPGFKEKTTAKKEAPKEKKTARAEKKEAPVARETEEKEDKTAKEEAPATEKEKTEAETPKVRVVDKIDLDTIHQKSRPAKKEKEAEDKKKEKEPAARQKIKEEEEEKKEKKAEAAKEETKKAGKEAPEVKEEPTPEPEAAKEKTATAGEEKAPAETGKEEAEKPEPGAKEKEPAPEEKEEDKEAPKEKDEKNFIQTRVEKLSGPKILDKIDLPESKKSRKKPVASSKDEKVVIKKKKRRRIHKPARPDAGKQKEKREPAAKGKTKGRKRKDIKKPELSEEEIQKQIRETLSRLSPSGKSKASKHRRLKRAALSQTKQEEEKKKEEEQKVIKATEFVTVNELATMMDVPVNDVISACMSLGLFVSINQRLDAETLTVVAEEFGYKVEFVSVEVQEAIDESEVEEDDENLVDRSPIVTVMGHVDHGKTKLLDHIRHSNVIAGEAGGITQHIGAYEVILDNGKSITFLDTPGHEAFTAMRARGAKITDVAIIVIAADDNVMPQTKEAINHAQAAGVPIVFALNKIDRPNANPDKIKQELADMDILVEDWGGKYQSQEISAKQGENVDQLLEKVLLEAELLELKGNPNKLAGGTIIESSLDKGRGYVSKMLVQNGTLHIGDMVLAGAYQGRVKAMYNERNQAIEEAGPSAPVLMLGLNGAPQAGDGFNVMKDEREAKTISIKRQQLQREQGIRTQKHITLDEIGRRIAIGDFKELNLIVKGDVDGSVEALSDSLLKQSTKEVQVNVIHRSVGAITESDVLLASASEAIIVGFQVRPSPNARKLAEQEQIDIRLYSIIYKAIEEIRAAIEGMLSPEIQEKITCNIEVRETFKITKVGTVAGCYVLDGKVHRNSKVRVIRDGIVVYSGLLGSLKRYKDDVKEVQSGYECGLNIENFNDIKVGDIIEGYEEVEVKRKL